LARGPPGHVVASVWCARKRVWCGVVVGKQVVIVADDVCQICKHQLLSCFLTIYHASAEMSFPSTLMATGICENTMSHPNVNISQRNTAIMQSIHYLNVSRQASIVSRVRLFAKSLLY
jgi:hypothetical protein